MKLNEQITVCDGTVSMHVNGNFFHANEYPFTFINQTEFGVLLHTDAKTMSI